MLTPIQQEALSHVKWYLNPIKEKQTGRTELAAHVYIQLALENPSREIRIIDHTYSDSIDILVNRIWDIFRNDYKQLTPLELVINRARKIIMVR